MHGPIAALTDWKVLPSDLVGGKLDDDDGELDFYISKSKSIWEINEKAKK